MSTPEEFLSRLDHVVDDYQVSADAMRWIPEPVEDPGMEFRPAMLQRALDTVQRLGRVEIHWDPPPLREIDTGALERRVAGVLQGARPHLIVMDETAHFYRHNWDALPVGEDAARLYEQASRIDPWPTEDGSHVLGALPRVLQLLDAPDQIAEALVNGDPDRPGHRIHRAAGVAAQHSPYGLEPRRSDGQVQGGNARRAQMPAGGRPRRARAHLGDRARP